MQFKQLEVFVKVAERKSFSDAAKELYLSQPTVSAHVRALEDELGCRLLERSTRSLTLTREGNTFLPYARRMLDVKSAALVKLRRSQNEILHIGASTIPSGYILPKILKNYRKLHPEVFFNVMQSNSAKIEEMVADRTLDIGLIGMPGSHREIDAVPLCEDRLFYVAPVTEYYHRLFAGKPSVERLLQEPLILRESDSGTFHALDRYLKEQGIDADSLNVIGNANDPEAIKQMILNRTGVSVLSGFSVADLIERGQVLACPLETTHPRKFYLIYHKDRELSPVEKSFLEFCSMSFRGQS